MIRSATVQIVNKNKLFRPIKLLYPLKVPIIQKISMPDAAPDKSNSEDNL